MSLDLEMLAETFGTPTYVYDIDSVRAGRDALFSILPEGTKVYYALKANPHPDIAMAVREGAPGPCGAEISSVGELEAALEARFPTQDILYTGPGKTSDEIVRALHSGVTHFSIESISDFRRLDEIAAMGGWQPECLLRINQGSDKMGASVQMMGRASQFGIDAESLPEIADELRSATHARVTGVHCYAGSNIEDESALVEEFRRAAALARLLRDRHGLRMEIVDLGGGFASPYTRIGRRTNYPLLRQRLVHMLDAELPGWREITIAVESGRYIVGESGQLLTRVTNVKQSRGKTFSVVDAGINTLGGLSGLNRLLPMSAQFSRSEAPGDVTVVGPLCTPGDLLSREGTADAANEGELLAIPNVGAYGPTASLLAFLGRPAPLEVLMEGATVVSCSQLKITRAQFPIPPAGGGNRSHCR